MRDVTARLPTCTRIVNMLLDPRRCHSGQHDVELAVRELPGNSELQPCLVLKPLCPDCGALHGGDQLPRGPKLFSGGQFFVCYGAEIPSRFLPA